MSTKRLKVCTIAILLFVGGIIPQIPLSKADLTSWVEIELGGTMTNSSQLSMPVADVIIRIQEGVNGVTANVSCLFEVVSDISINTSLAFVYPFLWHSFYSYDPLNQFAVLNFSVHVNDLEVNHTIISWDNLTSYGFNADQNMYRYLWLTTSNFVLFSFEMEESEKYNISVQTSAFPVFNAHDGNFRYVVGSAETFSGETHQTVKIIVDHGVAYEELTFLPETYLVESMNASGRYAVWEFSIFESAPISYVGFDVKIANYTQSHSPLPRPSTTTPNEIHSLVSNGLLLFIAVSIGVVILLIGNDRRTK